MKTTKILKKQKNEAMLENQRQIAFSRTSVYHWQTCLILVILFKLEARLAKILKNIWNTILTEKLNVMLPGFLSF